MRMHPAIDMRWGGGGLYEEGLKCADITYVACSNAASREMEVEGIQDRGKGGRTQMKKWRA